MNKTISINIAGFVFNIEEKAYESLNQYLALIKKNFQHEEDCEEIMDDIEARIAELLHEKISDRKEAILENDVEAVIEIMGKPEDYISDEPNPNFTSNEEDEAEYVEAEEVKGSHSQSTKKRRLYRDEQNGSVGGVCSGLGWFFGLDPVLVRIAFVLLVVLGGSGILLYIILWIVIPQAKTTAEILEMQGDPVNVDSIKDHVKGMKSNIKDGSKTTKENFKRAVNQGVRAGSHLAKSLATVFGILFMLGGVFALFILFIILFGDTGLLPLVGSEQVEDFPTLLAILYPAGRSTIVFIAIIIVTIIPIISLILTGVKMLFSIRQKYKAMAITAGIYMVFSGKHFGLNRDRIRNEF